MKEIVFEVLAEGGGLAIERKKDLDGEKFIYHHSEFDPGDEGLGINESGEYSTFEQAFQLINSKYPWFRLHLSEVHEEYRNYVIDELIKALTFHEIAPAELRHSQRHLEERLNIKLEYGNQPLKSELQNIQVENLIKFTEYEHHEYKERYNSPSNESKFVPKAKFETWLAGGQTFQHEQVTLSSDIVESFDTIGKLEVNGSTVIIKNEFEQIQYVFSSDKFFVSTTPILSRSKVWFYTSK